MKKTVAAFFLIAGMAFGIDYTPLSKELADIHYLAIGWSNNIINAQQTASNALPAATWNAISNSIVYTNTAVYTATVAKASTAIQPNTTATVAAVSFGTNTLMSWDGEEKTQGMQFTHPDGGTVTINQESYRMWRNTDSVPITNGQPVCLLSGSGQIGTIKLADADDVTRNCVIGVYTGDQTLPVNSIGRITTFGAVNAFGLPDLTDTAVSEGANLYLSTIAGRYVTNPPAYPAEHILCGIATYVQANNSVMEVNVDNMKTWAVLDAQYNRTNYANYAGSNIIVAGNVTLTNTVWDDITVSALQLNNGAAAPELRVYNNGSLTGAGIKAVQYDSGDSSFGQIQVKHSYKAGSDLHPHIHWSTIDDRSAITNISFRLDTFYGRIHHPLTNVYSQTITVTGTNAYHHSTSSFPPFGGTNIGASAIVHFEATCVEDGGTNDKLFIHDVDFHFEIDKIGSDNETPNGI